MQSGAEGTDERVLALRTVRCRGRDALPWRKDKNVERVTETMREIRREL